VCVVHAMLEVIVCGAVACGGMTSSSQTRHRRGDDVVYGMVEVVIHGTGSSLTR
jgi:hypothetical protein